MTDQQQLTASRAGEERSAAPSPVLVVLGLGSDGKPHGARFAHTDTSLVVKAAAMTGFHALNVAEPAQVEVAAKLPEGKIFASGRGFVPFIRRDFYDKLAGLVGTLAELKPAPNSASRASGDAAEATAAAAAQASSGTTEPAAAPSPDADPWSLIKVGTTVLARDDAEESWYEAIVIGVADDDQNALRLRWRDYPLESPFKMHRRRLGIVGQRARI